MPGSPTRADRGSLDLVCLARLAWTELPVLALVDLLVTFAAAVVAVTALAAAPLAPLTAALLLGPVWLGATAACLRMGEGEAVGFGDLLRELRDRAKTGMSLALAPAAVGTLLLGSVGLMTAGDGRRWMLAPVAVDALVLIVLAFGGLAVFPLAVLTDLRGSDRWLAAIALAGRHLVASAGLLALSVLLALSARVAGPFLVLAMAGPACLLTAATVRDLMLPLPDPDRTESGR